MRSSSSTNTSSNPSPIRKRGKTSTKPYSKTVVALAKAAREASPEPMELEQPLHHLPTGDVFVVGSGDCGQLGLGPDVFEKERPAMLHYFSEKEIVIVKAGGLHNVALSKDGKVYSWGCNDQCALGRTGEETEPGWVQGLEHERIIQVACGDSCTAALTQDGRVYAWGTFRDNNGIFGLTPQVNTASEPLLIPELKHIKQIDAGANHLVAVSHEGKIYTWGVGEQGQLGRKIMPRRISSSSLTPRTVNFKPYKLSTKFAHAYAGGYHTFLVHETGALFACGLNNYGQTGIGSTEEVFSPELVENLDEHVKIVQVDGGEHHSIALDNQGRVYVWGRADSGQLGLGSTDKEYLDAPARLSLDHVAHISAGGAFSLALNTQGRVYAWGYGEMGQLGNGSEDAPEPFQMQLKDRTVLAVSAGGQHTLLLLAPK